ncbi:hypothetical protein [Streptantibioticus ferralitis]|uniref:Uncharacterized protein n=1 Tax=Streptantibioticus ferralitis TaxID=236510 RepID=A0ABT5YVN6_9ACTN|nr:hypothetical protein [Streptantibioticus ferralitis]MDF2255614.1 hypothetical protein [Streptantibioticus ferralitis]
MNYAVPANVLAPPQVYTPRLANVVARNIGDIELVRGGKFRQKGSAEIASALAVEHTIFGRESLTYDQQQLYKKPNQGEQPWCLTTSSRSPAVRRNPAKTPDKVCPAESPVLRPPMQHDDGLKEYPGPGK